MRKILWCALIPLLFSMMQGYSQSNDTVQLKDIIVPVSPAFNLLDLSPKTIERPGTVKSFTTSVVNLIGQSDGLPKNFSMEFAPYWFFRDRNMNIFKYYGLKIDHTNKQLKWEPNIFYGLRSTSISVGSVFKDSSKAVPVDVNYLAYSLKSNIISIRNKQILTALAARIISVNSNIVKNLSTDDCDTLLPESEERKNCLAGKLSADTILKKERDDFSELLTSRPVFTADIALASSTSFENNSFDNSHSNRTGGWLTLAYSQPLIKKTLRNDVSNFINAKNYLNLYGMFRVLRDNATVDFKSFTKENLVDIGGRVELELNNFSVSIENVQRINRSVKTKNTARTVGILQYRINDNLFIVATFGKDFSSVKNLVSLFGLNWGFGNNVLYKPFK